MRQIKAFSAKMTGASESSRKSFSAPKIEMGGPQGNVEVFMTPSLLKMLVKDSQRSVYSRFMTLMKSAKGYAKSIKDFSELETLKRVLINQITILLTEYVEVLSVNPSARLTTYLKIQTIAPQATESANLLSKVMIQANKIKKSSNVLPPKNQRDLNRAMNQFIQDIVGGVTSPMSPSNPINAAEQL